MPACPPHPPPTPPPPKKRKKKTKEPPNGSIQIKIRDFLRNLAVTLPDLGYKTYLPYVSF